MLWQVVALLSQIYFEGPLMEVMQEAHLFNDSKHFVDMPLKVPPKSHFNPPGNELEECSPADWHPMPERFHHIKDYHLRKWALGLHRIWKVLCRQVRTDVRDRQDHYSLLYVPNPFVIPGGRFREFYYWDSYWIVKGLLFSAMYDTAKGVIKNLAYMVEHNGFIPNGGRVYYLQRSQPPMFISMVHDYYMATGDMEFILEMLPWLEKEFQFWLHKRSTPVKNQTTGEELFRYFQYRATLRRPRPESYREDLELVKNVESQAERERIWSDVASAAESGWDFSTRWFAHTGAAAFRLDSIRTTKIVPVDLNAFLCLNARFLSRYFELAGNYEKALYYQKLNNKAKLQMAAMHWNATDQTWYDHDLETGAHVTQYYISNAVPLYARCYDDDRVPHQFYHYLKRVGAFNSSKGIPTSFIASKQQWDSDNAWPPMVHIVIEGFRTSEDNDLKHVAQDLATAWLRANYRGYLETRAMFEKYNVSESSGRYAGSGGEYEVQTGFGWTNGIILDLLNHYGDMLINGPEQRSTGFLEIETPVTVVALSLIHLVVILVFLCRRSYK